MIKKTLFTLITAILLILTGCAKNDISDLKIYVINRNDISASMSDKELISAAKSSGRLAFDGDDIEGYNWETHTVTFKEESVPSIGAVTVESGGSALFKVDDTYAFILIIKNELIYAGGFAQGSKNPSVPMQPYISDSDRYSFNILFESKYADFSDNRSNQSLYSFLNEFGLLSSKSN